MRAVWAWIFAAVVALCAPSAAAAADANAEAREAIVAVIQQQLDAFKRNDFDGAFALASPSIQRQFQSANNFMRMVIAGYRPVFRSRSVVFLDLVEADGRLVQRAIVEGPDGETVLALYPMVRLEDGTWRIDGCVLVEHSGKGI